MKIRWLGHAAFEIEAKEGKIFIDPWLSNNPKAAIKPEDIKEADLIVITHDHYDHLGDSKVIAKRTGATIVALPEVAAIFRKEEISTHAPNMGSFSEVKGIHVAFVPAIHTCSKGAPAGIIIKVEGKVVYHMGDTALFGDLRLISELYMPEIVLIPIGGFYVMGPKEAVKAVQMLKPKVVIPMHYGTFPVLISDPSEFISEVKKTSPNIKVVELQPGEIY